MSFSISTPLPGPRRQLILFGRYPVPGKTKTRLIPSLGPVGAAELQRRLTRKSLDTLLTANVAPVQYCYTGGTSGQLRRWLGHRPVDLTPQSSGHIGQRMQTVINHALDKGCGKVVLVGTDIPDMQAHHIQAAFNALGNNDLVLGPSQDGGFWLVGMRRKARIFDNTHWGTSDVLRQTLGAAQRLKLSTAMIETLNDMDDEADLTAWEKRQDWQRPYLSIVMPALNEAPRIEAAIEGARSADAEIIVVDGGSRDRTMILAQKAGAIVIPAPQGRALQQNRGARKARGKVVLFLHADTCLPQNYAAQVFDTLMPPDIVAGAFHFKTDYDHWSMRLIEKSVRIRSRLFGLPYGDQAIFMPRAVFEKQGGFPLVPIAEDLFLMRRLARAGRIGLASGSAITSGRRWQDIGVWRATAINYLIAIGCLAGVSPKHLAPLYRWWAQSKRGAS